jgi:curved DNA-binding protein
MGSRDRRPVDGATTPVKYPDYYSVLGVPRTASAEEIQRAYRELARKYHPDINKSKDAEARFKEINEAHEVLKDPKKRKLYDQLGHNWKAGQNLDPEEVARTARAAGAWSPGEGETTYRRVYTSGFNPKDFSEFFEAIFGRSGVETPGGFGPEPFSSMFDGARSRSARPRSTPARPSRGNVHAEVEVSLPEVATGTTRRLRLRAADGSMQERTVEVRIPPGVMDGTTMRLRGQAPPDHERGPAGDLLLRVKILPDPRFEIIRDAEGRPTRDLLTRIDLTPSQAALGDRVDVVTLSGTVSVTVPPGTSSGQRLRLRGRGLPAQGGEQHGSPGDLLAEVRIVVPRNLTPAERELYERLRSTESNFAARHP